MAEQKRRTIDYERVSRLLAEGKLFGEVPTKKKYGIAQRTWYRYKARLETDEKLQVLVKQRLGELASTWKDELAPAIRSGISFLRRAANNGDPKDPAAVAAVTGGLKVLAEVAQAERFLDARFGSPTGSAGSGSGEVGPGEEAAEESDPVH